MVIERLIGGLMRAAATRHMRLEPGAHVQIPAPPDRPLLLYIHVPFCEVLCPFCSFHRIRFDRERAERHFDALRREIALYHERGFRFDSVYVGGDTPTVLPAQLTDTLSYIRSLYPIGRVSVETNPDHLTPDVLDRLADAGVDRLSVGVQSFDDDLLRAMQRYETYGSGKQIMSGLARAHGRVNTLKQDRVRIPEVLDERP